MPDPRDPPIEDDTSPATKDPAEGPRGGDEPTRPLAHVPGHLGPAGDPAEGKE